MNTIQNAVLVRLSFSMFNNTREDKTLTREVHAKHALKEDAGSYKKNKLPKDAILPISQAASNARHLRDINTLPWLKGIQLLPGTRREAFDNEMTKLRMAFYDRVNEFVNRYDYWLAQAREMHNGTFDPSDYPCKEDVAQQFTFILEHYPVPQSNHYDPVFRSLYASQLESQTQQRIRQAEADLWKRLLTPVQKMAESLADPETIFRDTLVGNIGEIVAVAPDLNITGSAELVQAVNTIKENLAGLDAESLRDSKVYRRQAFEKASAIAAQFSGKIARKFCIEE